MIPATQRTSRPSGSRRSHTSPDRRGPQRSGRPAFAPDDSAYAMLMLGGCLVLGGGGTSNPLTEVLLELFLAGVALAWLWLPTPRRAAGGWPPLPALLIAGLTLLVPIAQLIPLPPAIWHGLPGRQGEVAALGLIGHADRWMPLSLTPARTFASLLAIASELLLFLAAARLGLAGRMKLLMVVVGVAVASILLGALQLSYAGGLNWSFYRQANFGWLLGFHANRNAETDALQIGLLALAALTVSAAHRGMLRSTTLALLVVAMLGIALATIMTGSRIGMGLLPLTYLFAVWMLWPVLRRRLGRTAWSVLIVPPLACAALALTAPVQNAIGRFATTSTVDDRRWDIWHDTMTGLHSVWPMGGGISSFQIVYNATQSIERLYPELEMRAHNDWLEWMLEAGLPGLVVLALVAAVLLACLWRALRAGLGRRAGSDYRVQVIFALGTLLHIGLHGIMDYPMRSMALVALIGTAAALLMPLPARTAESDPERA